MIRNFFKVSIRNLIRNKTYSVINLLGLSIGMACSILIFLFIIDELSYDKHHEKADQIYRIGIDAVLQGNNMKAYVTGAPVGKTFVDEIPEFINSTRVVKFEDATIKLNDKKFTENKAFFVDSTFFEMFSIDFLSSKPNSVLNTPFNILLTESAANKYFGSTDIVGRALNIENEEYLIQGIIKDCPSNSHFHYNILLSAVSAPFANYETWMSNDFSYNYVLLEEGVDAQKMIEKMLDVAIKYVGPEMESVFGVSFDEFIKSGDNSFRYLLQPITDIHLKSHTTYEIEPNSNIVYVYTFSIIAIFILFVAIINFMNLSTARSATRAKEVGIRKVVGAFRISLFKQFLFESIVMSMISLSLAMIIIESVLPIFNSFTLKELTIGYFSNVYVLPGLILLAIIVGVLSGLYSASYLSSTKILNVIKGKILSTNTHSWFRSFLVIFQFSVSIALFICTFIIYSQLNLLRNKDIGFNKENILVIENMGELGKSYESFKKELEANPLINEVTTSSSLPARSLSGLPIAVEGDGANKAYAPRMIAVENNFMDAYELKIKEGRFFSEDLSSDTFSIVLNEAAVKEFELENPVGKRLVTNFYGQIYRWNIIGVVKDFNYRSFHDDVDGVVLTSFFVNNPALISIKMNSEMNENSIEIVNSIWKKFAQGAPMDYYIMEDDFDNMHKSEFQTGNVFFIFSILAIFIACLGLFGLASFMAENKTKEIGIRKALGASTKKIVSILLIQFTKWVLWANVVAWPIAYFFMKRWLMNFAYQVEIKWWVFIASGILGLLIASITVSSQAIKAATANPVNSLRYE
ncbi:MAG TPA: hypothetical protein DCG75_11595 [Bacteroidales bacterium]|nr:hypothetical protein [Bacteroidales bacterium]